MTDEERKQLVNSLETYQGYDRELRKLVHDAAAEIRRLATELDEARKRLALIKADRDELKEADREGWKFGRRYD